MEDIEELEFAINNLHTDLLIKHASKYLEDMKVRKSVIDNLVKARDEAIAKEKADPYIYNTYECGRKQDYGNDDFSEADGWEEYDMDRGDYTETHYMRKLKPGRTHKPFRVYSSRIEVGLYDTYESAFEEYKKQKYSPSLIEVDIHNGKYQWIHLPEKKRPWDWEDPEETTPKPLGGE